MNLTLLPEMAATFMLIFARIGTLVMLMPGFGERGVPARSRLSIGLLLTFLFYPLAAPLYRIEMELPALFTLLAGELAAGLVIGATGRMLMSALSSAGVIIANQLGLAMVTAVDPSQGQQGAIFTGFLNLLAITLIFASNLHHLVIAAMADSFTLFAPGTLPQVGDATKMVLDTMEGSFRIAVQISAPFLVFGLVFNVGLGVLTKLMPTMQVFFIGLPATILSGLLLFALVLTMMMTTFFAHLQTGLSMFVNR